MSDVDVESVTSPRRLPFLFPSPRALFGAQPHSPRQTPPTNPVQSPVPKMSPLSPIVYRHVVGTGAHAAVSTTPSFVSEASDDQVQTVAPRPRNAGEDNREALYQELKAYIDTQIESSRSSNLASPFSAQSLAEDFTSRLESAVSMIAEEQARKFEELHATLESRMNSVIEQRIEHAMQDTNASHEKKFHQFISTVNHEIEQRMAQAEMQASQEARAIAAQAIEESKSLMHAHMSRDVGMSEEASALLRQHHDECSAKFQHHDEHIDMFRQRQDEHAALLHQVRQKYDELLEIHTQKPAPTQNVATIESVEQSIGTFREQMSYDVQRMVEDLMKKLDHMNDNVTIDVSDPRCDDIINQVQNLHSRLSEIEPVRQSCSPLLGRVGAYEAQGFAAKPAVEQGGTNEIKNVLVAEGCFKEGGGVREIRNFDEVDPSLVRSASADSNSEDYVMSMIQEIEAQAASLEKFNTLQTEGQCGQPRRVAKEEISDLSAPVDNLDNATPQAHREKFLELRAKAEEIEERLRGMEQEEEANLGGVA